MRLKELDSTDRAVSPVVGVALLIAIAVILAAVIGAVVLGIGVGMAEAPSASLEFEEDGDDLVVSHNGGDALDGEEIVLRGEGVDDEEAFGDLSAGDSLTLSGADDVTLDNGDVSIVWQDPNSNDESVIATYSP